MSLKDSTRYELPPEGITLLGYVVRRMHKTDWLLPVSSFLKDGKTDRALTQIALYAAAASTSFGRAYYQPGFNRAGEQIMEKDPATGIAVTARLDSRNPNFTLSYSVIMPDGGAFSGSEEITGTTIGFRGLGMPAPSKFNFSSGDYKAQLGGIITSELAPTFLGGWQIRAHGFMELRDSAGNTGRLKIERNGDVVVEVGIITERHSLIRLVWIDKPHNKPVDRLNVDPL
jgi:hypothetical protein